MHPTLGSMQIPIVELSAIYILAGLNAYLAARLWALGDSNVQVRGRSLATIAAVLLSAYVAFNEGDGNLTPLGAIASALSVLAVGMWVGAWR